jgi:hypothetical protein
LLGLALIQPNQEGQAAQSAENRQQKSPPKTQSSQPTEPTVPPPDSQKVRNDNQPLPEKKANYWKEAFGPATWSNWILAIVGIGAVIAAFCTLGIIERQTKATEDAAKAAQDSTDIMRLQAQSAALDIRRLNRAYLTVDSWTAKNIPAYAGNPWRVAISFSIYNPSRTAARIERLDYKVGTQAESLSHGIMLTPQERYEVHVPSLEVSKGDAVFTIRGEIMYRDIFRKERHRTFSQSLKCTDSMGFTFYQAEAIGMNDEQEWDKDD